MNSEMNDLERMDGSTWEQTTFGVHVHSQHMGKLVERNTLLDAHKIQCPFNGSLCGFMTYSYGFHLYLKAHVFLSACMSSQPVFRNATQPYVYSKSN